MKTQNLKAKPATSKCLSFRHVFILASLTLLSIQAYSKDIKNKASRVPASAFEEEVLTVPLEQKIVVQSLFAEDDAGVMRGVKDALESWNSTEEYAKKWDLGSTHLYKTPTTEQKALFIKSNLLRYVDKRIAGEVRNAEEGSTLHTVGKVEKSLHPNASVPIAKNISIKLKARVLEGKATAELRNPWVECNASMTIEGSTKILTKKDFNQLGAATGAEYSLADAQLVVFVDKQITDNIKSRLSSTSTVGSTVDADKRLEMMASFPFNL